MLSCFSEKKWTNFNSTHRRIHLHKASPISYNPPPKSTSDLTSAFYLCRLRSGAALWTWQIAYWSADVVVNVLSTWAAAAVACSLQPVLSPEHLQLSPLPPSLLPHYNSPLPSCYEGAPPPLSQSYPTPPSSHPPHPSLSSKVWKGSQTNAICSSRQKMAGETSSGPCDPLHWPAMATENKVRGRFVEKQKTPAQHIDKSTVGK